MPEAVASNSIPALEGQPTVDAFDLFTALEDTAATLYSVSELMIMKLEAVDERLAFGLHNVLRREIADLDDIRRDLGKHFRSQRETDRIVAEAQDLLDHVRASKDETDREMQHLAMAKRRDLILQQQQAGASPREISQIFQLRQSAVERIIARLTASEKGNRKAS